MPRHIQYGSPTYVHQGALPCASRSAKTMPRQVKASMVAKESIHECGNLRETHPNSPSKVKLWELWARGHLQGGPPQAALGGEFRYPFCCAKRGCYTQWSRGPHAFPSAKKAETFVTSCFGDIVWCMQIRWLTTVPTDAHVITAHNCKRIPLSSSASPTP